VSKELHYAKLSDEQVMAETQNRLREMKRLLIEVRDALKSAGGLE
jgi:hypothetical protein